MMELESLSKIATKLSLYYQSFFFFFFSERLISGYVGKEKSKIGMAFGRKT